MNRTEYLLEKYAQMHADYESGKNKFYTNPSTAMIDPFQIADNLYYVGDKQVCIHLIDTGDGLILLDSGFPCAIYLLVDSIWRAGFDPRNVRWILHSHGHYDHFGASEEFRNMYGTKLAISRVDAESLRNKPHRAMLSAHSFPYARIPTFDRELEDGEIFRLGRTQIRCVLTPGHCAGVMSFFFDTTYEGKTYLAGLFGGAGVNALTLPYQAYNEDAPDPTQDMLESIRRIWDEPVIIHLGNHPNNNRTLQKREQQLAEGGNPFIAPDSWHTFLQALQESTLKKRADNAALESKLADL